VTTRASGPCSATCRPRMSAGDPLFTACMIERKSQMATSQSGQWVSMLTGAT
jgi:hypothetical protein